MSKRSTIGLIFDRAKLCSALGVSDATIGSWEKRGMPAVRRGRGRGMKSLYDFDAVRAWLEQTGLGQGVNAIIARTARAGEIPPPAPVVQTSAQSAPDPDERAELRLEAALLALPAALRAEGLTADAITRVFDRVDEAQRRELLARGELASKDVAGLRAMVEEECLHPGTWTE